MFDKIKSWTDKHIQGDPVIWVVVLCLSVFGILVVYSASGSLAYRNAGGNTEKYLFRHSAMVALSIFVMWVAHKIDYRYYAKITRVALVISVPLCCMYGCMAMQLMKPHAGLTCLLLV